VQLELYSGFPEQVFERVISVAAEGYEAFMLAFTSILAQSTHGGCVA